MDYTNSDANVVHGATGHRMHQATLPVPTEVSARDMNMVIWSLMELLKAANLPGTDFNPDDADSYAQVSRAVQSLIGKAVEPNITHSMARLGDELELNSTALAVSLNRNRGGFAVDRHVLLLGDSHGWGQGSPEWEGLASFSNLSSHSAHLHSLGFMARIRQAIRARRGIEATIYCTGTGTQERTMPFALKSAPRNSLGVKPIIPIFGVLRNRGTAAVSGPKAFTNFYQAAARGDAYSKEQYRDKIDDGLFPVDLIQLAPETLSTFDPRDKPYHFEFTPGLDLPGSGAAYTQYSNGGNLVLERETATGKCFMYVARTVFPYRLVAPGSELLFPGYGGATISAVTQPQPGITAIEMGVIPAADCARLARLLAPGFKIFSGLYLQRQLAYADMDSPARAVYVAVRHSVADSGTLRFYFVDPAGAYDYAPYVERGAEGGTVRYPVADQARDWVGSARTAHLVSSSGSLEPAPKVTFLPADASGTSLAVIDTSPRTAGVDEDVVYRLDFGSRIQGRLYIEATGSPVFRGLCFGNNKVANFSMGGHTVGQWLGDSDSFNDPAHDHLADILAGTPARPSHVIVQLPIVNEYLRQTPIATFKANLVSLVTRCRGHLSASNNANFVGCDFLFFTTLRDRRVAFLGAAQSPITYDAYFQAAREVCQQQHLGFVDVERKLFDLVRKGAIDYQRLYNDDIHPSDFANEMIFKCLEPHIFAMV